MILFTKQEDCIHLHRQRKSWSHWCGVRVRKTITYIIVEWKYRKILKRRIFTVDTCPSSKLNNIEAKLTGVPPQCFVIVKAKPWA